MWFYNPASALKETSLLYTDGHSDTRTHGRTDRKADFSIPPEGIRFAGVILKTYLDENCAENDD